MTAGVASGGNAGISGLPYPPAVVTGQYGMAINSRTGVAQTAGYTEFVGFMNPGQSFLYFVENGPAVNGKGMTGNQFNCASLALYFNGWYRTN
jgi:hypothetical protein